MDNKWLEQIISNPEMLKMGHGQTAQDRNLGMGWLYYALARMYRPAKVVGIGSWRGFAPMMFARGMIDNAQPGHVTFIDPGMVDQHWSDPVQVQSWFEQYSVPNIKHYCVTTQEFVLTEAYRDLTDIDILFVDGYHSHEQAKFDHEAFADKMSAKSIALFHDSMSRFNSPVYGKDRKYEYSVCDYITELKQRSDLQVMDLPFENGLTLVRKV